MELKVGVTPEKERADHIEKTQENTKCDFQIEQLTKIKKQKERTRRAALMWKYQTQSKR